MTRRELWLTAGGLFAVALVIRAIVAAAIPFPTPEDTAYYYGVARNLVEGRGLVSDAIWSYQTPPLVFPRPAFEVWLPLPALLAAIPMLLLGTGFHASQVGTVLVGSLVPVLAWRLAADLAAELRLPAGRARTLAVGSGLTAAVSLPLLLHSALPDSTTPFTAIALGACLLMTRLLRDPQGARVRDARVLGLGVLVGLAALTRNEFVWLGLAWVAVAWLARDGVDGGGRRLDGVVRFRLIAIPAIVGGLVLVPWLIRDWAVFGSPFPGQAVSNALSVTGFDIFAYAHPPTVARYLGEGLGFLVGSRVEGFGHNLLDVLLVPSFPVGVVGLGALVVLPMIRGAGVLRPLIVLSGLTFATTTLLFPVSTTWGTFLHAAGPVHALLIVGCLAGLDAFIARVGRWRGWTNPVAWLGPTLTIAASVLFSLSLASYGAQARDVAARFAALGPALTTAGVTASELNAPVVTDFPIWYAEATGRPALALPDESPADVVGLATRFGARLLILGADPRGAWPAILAAGGPDATCFRAVPLDTTGTPALGGTRAYRIRCP
ncbi:MAG: hypothetical protein IVW53_09500 [Chloroflexi bacterium]|nr:hypothetical protein [Chloroflexota bacterium]